MKSASLGGLTPRASLGSHAKGYRGRLAINLILLFRSFLASDWHGTLDSGPYNRCCLVDHRSFATRRAVASGQWKDKSEMKGSVDVYDDKIRGVMMSATSIVKIAVGI
jgi:hypothetical protein